MIKIKINKMNIDTYMYTLKICDIIKIGCD